MYWLFDSFCCLKVGILSFWSIYFCRFDTNCCNFNILRYRLNTICHIFVSSCLIFNTFRYCFWYISVCFWYKTRALTLWRAKHLFLIYFDMFLIQVGVVSYKLKYFLQLGVISTQSDIFIYLDIVFICFSMVLSVRVWFLLNFW